jgi:hypothetical protein
MDAHYELSVVTDALAQLDAMIDQVGERLDAYHVVFGTGTETIYAPTQALWTDKYTDECADEDIPF